MKINTKLFPEFTLENRAFFAGPEDGGEDNRAFTRIQEDSAEAKAMNERPDIIVSNPDGTTQEYDQNQDNKFTERQGNEAKDMLKAKEELATKKEADTENQEKAQAEISQLLAEMQQIKQTLDSSKQADISMPVANTEALLMQRDNGEITDEEMQKELSKTHFDKYQEQLDQSQKEIAEKYGKEKSQAMMNAFNTLESAYIRLDGNTEDDHKIDQNKALDTITKNTEINDQNIEEVLSAINSISNVDNVNMHPAEEKALQLALGNVEKYLTQKVTIATSTEYTKVTKKEIEEKTKPKEAVVKTAETADSSNQETSKEATAETAETANNANPEQQETSKEATAETAEKEKTVEKNDQPKTVAEVKKDLEEFQKNSSQVSEKEFSTYLENKDYGKGTLGQILKFIAPMLKDIPLIGSWLSKKFNVPTELTKGPDGKIREGSTAEAFRQDQVEGMIKNSLKTKDNPSAQEFLDKFTEKSVKNIADKLPKTDSPTELADAINKISKDIKPQMETAQIMIDTIISEPENASRIIKNGSEALSLSMGLTKEQTSKVLKKHRININMEKNAA